MNDNAEVKKAPESKTSTKSRKSKSGSNQRHRQHKQQKQKRSFHSHRPTYVIDTNIILNDHTAPFSIKNADIVLPQMVVRELDKKQTFADNKSVAYNARAFGRALKALLREQQGSNVLNLPNGSKIILEGTDSTLQQTVENLGLEPRKPDSAIVASAWKLKKSGRDVTLLTNDTNMWVTARSLNIPVEDYDIGSGSEAYTGVKSFVLEDTSLMDAVYNGEKVYLNEEDFPHLHVHQILVFKGAAYNKSLLAVFKGYDKPIKRMSNIDDMEFSGIAPLNKEQGFAYELLTTDEIACMTIAGKAGTGKSMVALSYALHHLGKASGKGNTKKGASKYERIMILKPIVPLGRDVGFLPGTLEEKLGPWTESFFDSLDFIFQEEEFTKDDIKFKEKPYQHLIDRGIIEFLPLTFMRGRSLPNTLIILDEAQNTSVHEIKTLLTRTGEGSKVICLGDIDQIDAPWLDKQNNGLAYLIERGKNADMIGHVTFIKSHRSDLANWASDNL